MGFLIAISFAVAPWIINIVAVCEYVTSRYSEHSKLKSNRWFLGIQPKTQSFLLLSSDS
jgi:hypothetical protein